MLTPLLALFLFLQLPAAEAPERTLRMIDVDGDGRLDRLQVDAHGALSISIQAEGRNYIAVGQQLPVVAVEDVLAADLDGDGTPDLYLVSRGQNVTLLGLGGGRFSQDDGALGLADPGPGRSVEQLDVDGDGRLDVLLHNDGGDVLFWGTEDGRFERDASTPALASAEPSVPVALAALDAGSAEEGAVDGPFGRSPRFPDRARPEGSSDAPVAFGLPPGAGRATAHPGALPFPSPCATSVVDQFSGDCLQADSLPTLGRLYPLGSEFNITPGGEVGIGLTTPQAGLHLANALDSELRISPNTFLLNQGRSEIFLSEGNETACGWRLSYDGTANENPLSIISECTTPETRLAIHRGNGTVLLGGDDFNDPSAGPGRLRVQGGVSQPVASAGLIKAAAHVCGIGTSPTVTRSFSLLPGAPAITVVDLGVGRYAVDFGVYVSTRFYFATMGPAVATSVTEGIIGVAPRTGFTDSVFVETRDPSGAFMDAEFYLVVL